MSSWGRRLALPAALSMGLASCADPVLDVKVNIVKQTCGGLDPMKDVAQFKVTVFGDGVDSDAVQTRFEVADGSGELPKIPVGTGRNIVVEGLDASDRVVSRGETGALDLAKKDAKESVSATVFLRKVDAFTPSNLASDPSTCSALIQARAGHTATKLSDGRVLIAGGYRLDGTTKTYLASTEIYDPKTGQSSPGPDILPRTFHTATHIPGTKLTVIAGGETDGKAIGAAQIYNEESNSITNVGMKTSRTRHIAVLANPTDGGPQPPLMLVGGFSNSDANTGAGALHSAEILDLAGDSPSFRDVSGPLGLTDGLAEASTIALLDGTGRVAVVGGWSGQNAVKNLMFMQYNANQNNYTAVNATATLNDAHLWPILAIASNGLLIATGGFEKHNMTTGALENPITTTEYVNVKAAGSFTKAPLGALPEALSFTSGVGLLNGKVLAVGGQSTTTDASPNASIIELAETNLKRRPTTNTTTEARYLHAMTLLDDGSVLVTGGLKSDSNETTALGQIDVFQPAYVTLGADPHN